MRRVKSLDQSGLSLVELMSVIVVTGIFMTLILFFGFSYWRYASLLQADLDTYLTRLNAGDVIREMIGSSSGMNTQNAVPDTLALAPDTSQLGSQYWEVIHAIPKTITATGSGYTPVMYFSRPSLNTNKTYIMNGSVPYQDDYILYLNNSAKKLMLRALPNPSATNNRVTKTCAGTEITSTCPSDKIIASDVASVQTRYFSRSGTLIDYTSSTDPVTGGYTGPDFPTVEVVEIQLNLTQKPYLQKANATNNSTVIRVALRNA